MTGGRLITIIGPTASGKTALAAALADRLGAEIISADSRQVYRGMDIGTGKDLDEYVIGGHRVPCHLIDVRDAGYHYNLFEYQEDFLRTYRDLMARGKDAVLCGGSGLYVESVLKGYAMMPVPEDKALRSRLEGKTLDELTAILATYKRLHNTTDTDTPKRAIRAIEIEEYYRANNITARQFPSIDSIVFGIQVDRETRRQRISRRLDARLDGGLVDEVRRLLDEGVAADDLKYYGLEYKYVTAYVLGEKPYDEMHDKLETAIHQFAKRQMTWFRGMERRGIAINWIDGSLPLETKLAMMIEMINQKYGNAS